MVKELKSKFEKISIQKCILFHYLVKEGTPAAVARKLKVAAFKVHNDLNSVEKSIGEPLIYRNHRRLTLTEMGQNFAEFCRLLVENLSLVEPSKKLPDELTIATTNGIAEIELPQILVEFCKEYPDIKITIMLGYEFLDFTDARIDVVIGPHLSNRGDLSQNLLHTDPMHLYASPNYIEKYGVPKTIYDLKQHHILLHRGLRYTPREVFDIIDPFIVSDSMRGIYGLTLNGLGIGALPQSHFQSETLPSKLMPVLEGLACYEIKTNFIQKRFSSKRIVTDRLYEITKNYFEKVES